MRFLFAVFGPSLLSLFNVNLMRVYLPSSGDVPMADVQIRTCKGDIRILSTLGFYLFYSLTKAIDEYQVAGSLILTI